MRIPNLRISQFFSPFPLSVNEGEDLLSYEDIHEKLEEVISHWYTTFKTAYDDPEKLKVLSISGSVCTDFSESIVNLLIFFSMKFSQDFQNIGIDSDFFESVGHTNPFLDASKFETFSYYQKVIILRALCDNWVVSEIKSRAVPTAHISPGVRFR